MQRTILKSTIIGIVAKSINVVSTLVIIPIMIQQLGSLNYGIWITISSGASLISFMDLGLGNSLMGFIAQNESNRKQVSKYINIAYTIQLCIVFILVVVFTLSFNYINWAFIFNIKTPSEDILTAIFIAFFFFFFNLLFNTIYSIQRGLQRSDLANLWQIITSIFSFVILFFCLQLQPSIKWVSFAVFGTPTFISLINSIWYLKKETLIPKIILKIKFKDLSQFLTNSGLLFYLQIAAIIAFQTDTLILAHYTSFDVVTKFSIMVKFFSVTTILLNVYLQSLWPSYSKAYGSNSYFWVQKTFNKSLLLSVISTFLFIVFAYFTKEILLKLWLKVDFDISTTVFIAFSIWLIISVVDSNIGTLLNALQLLKVQAYLSILMVVSNLIVSVYLVKKLGISGVVWGTSISTLCFSCIPLFIYVRKFFKKKLLILKVIG